MRLDLFKFDPLEGHVIGYGLEVIREDKEAWRPRAGRKRKKRP